MIIANLHEMYNFLLKEINKPIKKDTLKKNYTKILQLMLPIIPHYATECIEELVGDIKQSWPKAESKYLKSEFCSIVIQINGKKREIIQTKMNITEEELIFEINKNSKINANLTDKTVIKKIFIPNKLINLIIK